MAGTLRWIMLAGAVLALLATSLAPTPAAAAPTTVTFNYTGGIQSFVVPTGVEAVDVVACGAQGGASIPSGPPDDIPSGPGGLGGESRRSIDVTPGETLHIGVGGSGANGGWNGGGYGIVGGAWGPVGGGHGGGASDVRQGGTALSDRVVVGGGGGAGGVVTTGVGGTPVPGGIGGGLTGGAGYEASAGTQTGPGTGFDPTQHGSLGVGGNGFSTLRLHIGSSGGGGGLYGGAGSRDSGGEVFTVGHGAGGSGLGDSFDPGSCAGNGWVTLTYDAAPAITPFGAIAYEGDTGTTTINVPVFLSNPSPVPVTIEWSTVDGVVGTGLAASGSDFVAASGTVTFDPGETTEYVSIEILGDTTDEPALLWGEWGLISFTNPTNATLDTATFFGHGLFIIVDDD